MRCFWCLNLKNFKDTLPSPKFWFWIYIFYIGSFLLDIASTIYGFIQGNYEKNPFVNILIGFFGYTQSAPFMIKVLSLMIISVVEFVFVTYTYNLFTKVVIRIRVESVQHQYYSILLILLISPLLLYIYAHICGISNNLYNLKCRQ